MIGNAHTRIEEAVNGLKTTLDLSSLKISFVPKEILNIQNLKSLNLSYNSLEELPEWFGDLTSLESLDIRGNILKWLPHSFSKLVNLRKCFLRNNKLTEIPLEFRSLKNLSYLSLANNQIQKIPSWIVEISEINVDNNPIIDPPIEIYNKGFEALKNYFKEKESGIDNLYEAKVLIVGEPGAGKTTLMNLIKNEDFYINVFQNSTKGIEILPHYFVTQDRQYFRINIWDFGGQEIYHATHQFFLTRRSLYILVSGNRAEDTDFYYWLQTINLLSENSPLVIVQNEMQDRKRDINIEAMKERFSIIKKSFSFNFSSNKNALRSLVHEIHNQVVKLPHIGTELPKIWVDIRKILEDIAEEKAYISEFEYLKICSELGMREKERALFLSDYFHDLGVFLHFKDNALLKRWIILKPDWGTEAVYKVLDDENVIANNGYFNKEDLKKIWSDSTYVDMHDELISLMMKFELCYQLESSETYIAAQLLKRKKPKYNWIDTDNLIVRYEYDFMPKGVITRFIVRMNFYIEDQRHVWREGVILERYETRAEVIETYGSREIRIRLSGKHKKEFLAIILDSFDKIHLSYSNLIVKKLIPCNCVKCSSSTTKHYFEYNILKNFLAMAIQRVFA